MKCGGGGGGGGDCCPLQQSSLPKPLLIWCTFFHLNTNYVLMISTLAEGEGEGEGCLSTWITPSGRTTGKGYRVLPSE